LGFSILASQLAGQQPFFFPEFLISKVLTNYKLVLEGTSKKSFRGDQLEIF
jgi:hypothetical protein